MRTDRRTERHDEDSRVLQVYERVYKHSKDGYKSVNCLQPNRRRAEG